MIQQSENSQNCPENIDRANRLTGQYQSYKRKITLSRSKNSDKISQKLHVINVTFYGLARTKIIRYQGDQPYSLQLWHPGDPILQATHETNIEHR